MILENKHESGSNQKNDRKIYLAMREMDVQAFTVNFAEEATFEDPAVTPVRHGKAKIGEFLEGILSLTGEFGLTENQIFVSADTAAVKWTGNGTTKNGQPFEFEGIDIFEFNEDGLIRSLRAIWDAAPVMAILTEQQQ